MLAESCTYPIDTAKTRLQLQGQHLEKRWQLIRYKGMTNCLVTIVKEEGVKAMYQGLSSALVRQAVYGTIKFGLYYSAKETLSPSSSRQSESCLLNLACAVFAGSLSSAIATPTDVIKVRMQANATHGVIGGFSSVGRDIFVREGVKGLWRGVLPTAQRAALVAGVQLPVYDLVKEKICNSNIVQIKDNVMCHLVSSMTAGLTAAVASNPCDVVRTRIMVQRKFLKSNPNTQSLVLYRSAVHCAIHTVKTEGVLALYKGFVPSFARMGPWNVIFFVAYEKLKLIKI